MPYLLITMGLVILFKYLFTIADNDSLFFLLKPTDIFIEILTATKSVYLANSGYYHEKLNIIIDKSCSGFNFWLICFVMLIYLFLKYSDKNLRKFLAIPIALFISYLLTLFVNTSRIFASIIIQNQTKSIQENWQHIIHEAIGIITNLTFLIIVYYITEKYIKHRQQHAKLT